MVSAALEGIIFLAITYCWYIKPIANYWWRKQCFKEMKRGYSFQVECSMKKKQWSGVLIYDIFHQTKTAFFRGFLSPTITYLTTKRQYWFRKWVSYLIYEIKSKEHGRSFIYQPIIRWRKRNNTGIRWFKPDIRGRRKTNRNMHTHPKPENIRRLPASKDIRTTMHEKDPMGNREKKQ